MTFHCLFQDDIEKSGRYEFYCGPDDADDVSPAAFCVQVRIGKGLTNIGQTCLIQSSSILTARCFTMLSERTEDF